MSLALHRDAGDTEAATSKLVLPPGSAEEAALGAASTGLPSASSARRGGTVPARNRHRRQRAPPDDGGWARLAPTQIGQTPAYADLADVKGQAAAKRALEIAGRRWPQPAHGRPARLGQEHAGAALCRPAAAHGHHRSAGVRRGGLARRALPSGALGRATDVCAAPHRQRRGPGGAAGSPPRPGAKSRSHTTACSFWTSCPSFRAPLWKPCREPLESGHIRISRAAMQSEFPGTLPADRRHEPLPLRFSGPPHQSCRDTPDQIARYQSKPQRAHCSTASTCTWKCPPCRPTTCCTAWPASRAR